MTVNGECIVEEVDPNMLLLHFLRDTLKLFGAKEACGEGECGACTIILNGKTVNSCLVLAIEAQGGDILTVEGLSKDGELSILQQEFIKEDALQCGFCTPGMLMSARSLLDRHPDPTDEEIKEGMGGNLCRCTGYQQIFDAIKRAAKREREELNRS
ncbi:MAG: (2Fe-2S)-binding protein [Clostridiales bacterium]|jgi:carbon-monoxide dehydrogenase small subunit|nr:(2Fe-2S)-binding protein [Clostridiales bacterium]MCK9350411.1 (2Fe-2S)-binding protein [Clostridiales bacterium]MDD2572555.1 (2Fe-2S)-binding protein [Eubacteriales bacterium]MDD4186528.1 (2Fe-2S)-binding protein [Eubacteriales bacterium]